MKKSNKRKGINWEKKVERSISSGSLWFNKGDLSTLEYLIDCKKTDKLSYRITTETLQKIWVEALEANKLPALVIGIKDWVITARITRRI